MSEEHRRVAMAIEDRFFEEQKLSDLQDIADHTGLSRSKVDRAVEDMRGTGLVPVYEKNGSATLYLTDRMFNSIHAQAGEPEWIEDYEFDTKQELREEIQDTTEKISGFQKLERLLYGTGSPLEDSVEYALQVIGFNPDSTESDEDFLLEVEGHNYVIEVKGVGGSIDKSHANQLGGWLNAKLDQGIEPDNLTGIIIHNHERETDPQDRDYPLTSSAERFLKHQQSRHISTKTLFELAKDVKNENIEDTEAKESFLEGDPYAG